MVRRTLSIAALGFAVFAITSNAARAARPERSAKDLAPLRSAPAARLQIEQPQETFEAPPGGARRHERAPGRPVRRVDHLSTETREIYEINDGSRTEVLSMVPVRATSTRRGLGATSISRSNAAIALAVPIEPLTEAGGDFLTPEGGANPPLFAG